MIRFIRDTEDLNTEEQHDLEYCEVQKTRESGIHDLMCLLDLFFKFAVKLSFPKVVIWRLMKQYVRDLEEAYGFNEENSIRFGTDNYDNKE